MSRVLGIILCLTVSTSALGTQKNWWERDPVFLSKDALPITEIVLPPPPRHSKIDQSDIQKLLELQAHRTAAECARANRETSVSLSTFFGSKGGPLYSDEVKDWTPFFEKVQIDTNYFVHAVKHQWMRPRPYLTDSKLHPCIHPETTTSYPSGHAAIARVFAHVLSVIDPERTKQFEARADQIALDRVLGGVHHPTDIDAGQKLGDAVFLLLKQNKRFKAELDKLKEAYQEKLTDH